MLKNIREKAQRVDDILEEYKYELSKEACDKCPDCGDIFMCGKHSILSLLQGHTMTNVEINRILQERKEMNEAKYRKKD